MGEHMKAVLVNNDRSFAPARLVAPSSSGFVYVAVQSGPRRRPGVVVRRDVAREAAVGALRACAGALIGGPGVRQATIYRAAMLAPAVGGLLQPDATMLVETPTPDDAKALAAGGDIGTLRASLQAGGARVEVMAARNARRIADVEHRPGRLYLFNHFAADDETVAIEVWDRLAAWYQRETGLENSMLLAAADGDDPMFTLVNHAAFDQSLFKLAVRQFSKRSFFTYVRANLVANDLDVVPVLYRLAGRTRAASTAAPPVAAGALAGHGGVR